LFKKFHKKKVILVGVGAAERFTAFDKYLYGKSLKSVDAIYVRDGDSLSVLENIFGVSSRLIPDVAFYISEIYKYPPHKEKRVLFCPVSYEFYKRKRNNPDTAPDENEYLQYWEDRMLEYFNDDYQVKLFSTCRRQDLPMTEKLKQILYDEHGIDVEILDINALEEMTKEIARSEVVVSARMHALIIGFCYGCKVVPYRTSEKIDAFEKEYISGDTCLDEVQKRIIKTIKKIVTVP
jgi:polysaccharide pyruvyl transferase WcaK-like protein